MYYLSIDQGGSSSRALICDQQGNIISQHQVKVTTQRAGACIEQSPEELVSSIQRCIHVCYASLNDLQKKELVSASLVTQRSSFIAIDKQNKTPLTQVISWQDTRGQQLLDTLNINNDWLNEKTGLRASAHYGASKMLWCLKNNNKVQQAANTNNLMFLPIAAYLAKQLTNQLTMPRQNKSDYYVDPANASRTLLFDSYNLQWDKELLSTFGIKNSWLPKIQPTLSHYGDIQLTDKSIPLNYLNGDQSAAIFAFGQPKENELYLNIGTGAFVSYLQAEHSAFDKGLLRSLVFTKKINTSDTDKTDIAGTAKIKNIEDLNSIYVQEGTVNGAGAALDFIAEQLKLTNFIFTEETFKQSNSIIPLFINTVGGLAAPYWRTDIPAYFIDEAEHEHLNCRLKLASTNKQMIAVLESIAFLITVIIKRMINKTSNIQDIRISGGLSNNQFLCQMIADLTHLNVIRPDEVEASALGAVWCLAHHNETADSEVWLTYLNEQTFVAKKNKALINRFEQWQNILVGLTD